MMKWLYNLANKRPPDHADHYDATWKLMPYVELVVQLRSDDKDDYRPLEERCLVVLLSGKYIENIGPEHTDVVSAPAIRYYRKGTPLNVELLSARSGAQTVLDFPGWDGHFRNTDRVVWALVIGR